uniref:Uncharacterized protein n=1 Tax=Pseudo-nitzschia australis TaxID=44445 RepID=A0A7S4A9P8_9STRA|mmetsp:Transcript_28737/g.60221  ORF Transcript_28737/g.60221 Transcript_28737/m.60221 type:complete len:221 (+) Transcript_28737:163-825(+)
MGVITLVEYIRKRIRKPLSSGNQDLGVALALYAVYPAILWLLIDKFHGICGTETYAVKHEAVAANNAVFVCFTVLLRTYKIASILLYQADASDKQEDPEEDRLVARDGGEDDEACTKQRCIIWFFLGQELMAILCVAFLLLVCLPVLAFWFMFIGIWVSVWNIFTLLKRLWKDAHSVPVSINDDDVSITEDTEHGDEIEFEEFVNNFAGSSNDFDENESV